MGIFQSNENKEETASEVPQHGCVCVVYFSPVSVFFCVKFWPVFVICFYFSFTKPIHSQPFISKHSKNTTTPIKTQTSCFFPSL